MLRIIRIFRLFRINAYYDSLNVITEVIVGKKQQLLSSVFIILILMISSSLCMYSLENKAQPEVFTNAFSVIWRFDRRRYLTIQMRSDISFLYNLPAPPIQIFRNTGTCRCFYLKGVSMNDTFMKEKPVFPLIMSMALPMVISMLVNSLYNIVDSFFVAQISENAMTALSLVFPVQNFANAIAIGFGIGISSQIAICLGAGNRETASKAATHGLALSGLHGVILTIGCILVMPGFLALFTGDADVIDLGIRYSTIVFLFATINTLNLAYEKIFQGVGKMKITMIGLLVGCVSNIILDPLLIFGLGPFPALGIEGAALATGLGQVFNLVFYLIIYKMQPIQIKLSRRHLIRTWLWQQDYTLSVSREH